MPLPSLEGIEHIVSLLHTGYLFTEQDFAAVQTFFAQLRAAEEIYGGQKGHGADRQQLCLIDAGAAAAEKRNRTLHPLRQGR
ncbi:hypothetical protein VQ056_28585 [Paenibacillus sp. JTLBN-2024]